MKLFPSPWPCIVLVLIAFLLLLLYTSDKKRSFPYYKSGCGCKFISRCCLRVEALTTHYSHIHFDICFTTSYYERINCICNLHLTPHPRLLAIFCILVMSESIVFTTSFTVDFWKIINCMSMMDQLCYMPFGRVATSYFWSYGWLLLLVYSGCFGVANNCFLPSSMSRTSAVVGRLPGSNWVHSSPISKHLFISVSWDSLYKDRSNRSSICCLLSRTFQAWEEHYIVQC